MSDDPNPNSGGAGKPLGNPENNTGRSRNSAPIVELRGDELGVKAGESIQGAAQRYYEGLMKTPATREGFGDVSFHKGSGWKKLESASLPAPDRLKLLPAVKPIIEHGDYIGRAAAENRRDGIVAFHYFEGNVKIGGETKFVGVSVGEDAFKRKFYNLNENPDVLLAKRKARGSSGEKALSPAPSGDSASEALG